MLLAAVIVSAAGSDLSVDTRLPVPWCSGVCEFPLRDFEFIEFNFALEPPVVLKAFFYKGNYFTMPVDVEGAFISNDMVVFVAPIIRPFLEDV